MKSTNKTLLILIIIYFNNSHLKASDFLFLGWKIQLKEYPLIEKHCNSVRINLPCMAEEIEKFKNKMPKDNFLLLCEDIEGYKKKYGISDFVFVEFVKKVAKQYSHSEKAKKLLAWEIFKHFDYETFIQFSNKQLIVFLSYDAPIDGVAFIESEENKIFCDVFYETSTFSEPMAKFPDEYKGNKEVVFDINCIKNISETKLELQKINVLFEGKEYVVKYKTNKELVAFLNSLPKIKLGNIYTSNFGISNVARTSLLKEINGCLKDLDTIQGLNFLLNFCQQIKYTDDQSLWNKERYFFPEQSLSVLNMDCDDKSILFSCLVKQVYNLETVGILYPQKNHINVGLRYSTNGINDFINYEGFKYIVCEPTGSGFKIGKQNNTLKNQSYDIIKW